MCAHVCLCTCVCVSVCVCVWMQIGFILRTLLERAHGSIRAHSRIFCAFTCKADSTKTLLLVKRVKIHNIITHAKKLLSLIQWHARFYRSSIDFIMIQRQYCDFITSLRYKLFHWTGLCVKLGTCVRERGWSLNAHLKTVYLIVRFVGALLRIFQFFFSTSHPHSIFGSVYPCDMQRHGYSVRN